MEKELLKQRMNEYLLSGFGIPKGLEEEWKALTKKDFKPSELIKKMYWVVNGRIYNTMNNERN